MKRLNFKTTCMKKLIILTICLLSLSNLVKAQYVDIPDSNFRDLLISKYPACFNVAGQMDTTCIGIVNEDTLEVFEYKQQTPIVFIHSKIKDLSGLQYFKKLTYLDCSRNDNLIHLPSLPNSLKHLDCSADSSLVTFPSLPSNLQYFDCGNHVGSFYVLTRITPFIPTLPNSLQYLGCINKGITSLPNLPDSLRYLQCGLNKLTSLPNLPESLSELDCSNNYLTMLPPLPRKISSLTCFSNRLQSLPLLPDSLRYLHCGYNKIVSLQPNLPKYLTTLYIVRNPLSQLPTLDTLEKLNTLVCSGVTNLLCLPKLPISLKLLVLDSSGVHCLPNKPPLVSVFPSSLQLCAPTNNVNQCLSSPTVTGRVFIDENNNGIKDGNEHYIPNVPVRLNTGEVVYTNNVGEYVNEIKDTGRFTLFVTAPPHFKAVPDSINLSYSTYNSSSTLSDIALQPTDLVDSLNINIYHLLNAVPGHKVFYCANYVNLGTTATAANLTFTYDTTKLIFDSTSVPLVSHIGNTLTWKDTLTPNYFGGIYNYGYKYPSFAFTVKKLVQLGDSITCSATVVSAKASATTNNTTVARSSYDPNSKEATPQLTTKQVISGQMIDYVIHFQNVGNAPADNVVIADTISPLLTNGVMQLIGSSHNVKTSMDSNIIYFDFHNINLIDSTTDQLKSNGFVHFRLKPRTSISEGTNIDNKASVYFDYNSPVVTNTATTLIKDYTLPVSIRSFSAQEILGSNGQVASDWTCTNELNMATYNVQRSVDASSFNTIGSVTAKGNGNYSFLDLKAGNYAKYKTIYYRLQMVDKDGSIRYSKTVSVQLTINNYQLSIYPNPAKSSVIIKGNHIASVQVIDYLGRVIKTQTLKDATNPTLSVGGLPVGVYHLSVQTTDGKVSGVGFVKE